MSLILRSLFIFIALLVVSSLMIEFFDYEFGTDNFFDKRGIFFLFFITLFPRLTLLFSSVPFGGFLWWLGFIFCPRFLVAILATVNYFHSNPVLVVISWLIAFGGEGFEKWVLGRRPQVFVHYQGRSAHWGSGPRPGAQSAHRSTQRHVNENTVEAEYKRKN